MSDRAFQALLNGRGWICRPRVRLEGDLTATEPVYEVLAGAANVRIRPVSGRLDETAIGKTPSCTHIGYLAPTELRPGDRLAQIERRLALAAGAVPGSRTIVVTGEQAAPPGAIIHLHSGRRVDQVVVVGGPGGAVSVEPGLAREHAAGEDVWLVRLYEVQGVLDESGAGHHLKVTLEEVAG